MSFYDWILVGINSENCSRGFLEILKYPDLEFTKALHQKTLVLACLLGVFSVIFIYWFHRNRLRYLLRFSCVAFILASLLNVLCLNQGCCKKWITNLCDESAIQWSLASSAILIVAMIIIRYNWSQPINIIKVNDEVYSSSHSLTWRSKRRMQGDSDDMPPVYPNGWIPIVESRQVKAGNVIAVIAIGQKFCVFRGVKGQIYVLDSTCPHLGADLTAGGRVRGDCIECPFHGWEFDGKEGHCLRIPYSENVPKVAKVKTWRSCEVNGFVYVWHHAEDEEPSWEMLTVEAVESGEWKYRGRMEHTTYCHIQDVPENGADVGHLNHLHGEFVFSGNNWMTKYFYSKLIRHQYYPEWNPDDKMSHVAKLDVTHCMYFCGYELPFTRVKGEVHQIGPSTVYLFFDTWFGKGVFLHHVISEEPYKQRIVHQFYTENRFKQLFASIHLLMQSIMVDRDVVVWSHKKLLTKPVLVKEDKSIHKYRRWFSQFYSKHSPTLRDLQERNLDW